MKRLVSLFLVASSLSFAGNFKANSVVLSKDGISGIESSTSFKRLTIKRLFPKLKVQNSTKSMEGESYKIINVKQKNTTLFSIEASTKDRFKVGEVTIFSTDVDNKFDFKIGDKYKKVLGQVRRPKCSRGVEEMSASVICTDKSMKNFRFVFDGKFDGPDDKMPPRMTLLNFKLTKIIWNADKH